jgi:adenylate cyclase
MMIDLREFTLRTRSLSPAETIAIIADYHSLVVPIVQHHGGSIDKYLGDGVLASFGAVVAGDRPAADAVEAALEIADAARVWRQANEERGAPAFDLVVALTLGEVLCGPIGHQSRLEYTVMGEPVNLGAKLEKHAKRESAIVVMTREIFEAARAQGGHVSMQVELRPGRLVEGIEGPVDLAVVARPDKGRRAPGSKLAPVHGRLLTLGTA